MHPALCACSYPNSPSVFRKQPSRHSFQDQLASILTTSSPLTPRVLSAPTPVLGPGFPREPMPSGWLRRVHCPECCLPACCPEVPSISGGYFSVSLTLLFAPLLFRFPHFPREMPIASMLSSSTYTSTDLHIYWHVSLWMSMGTSKSMHPTHTHRHFAKGISPPGVRTW